ncbi:hypothetical protein GCM10011383_38370 [Hymenobacter cavernae]|uniref:Uncharacterized protein n=2 Tax=Hymenobacter cavernae TaxID=2044852 RepID=A0ABQ1UQT0_9BACT|nr:hypothetical protein GCM10011383_38370 [Hymenobacter cavernae]
MASGQVKQDTDKMRLIVKSDRKKFPNDHPFIVIEFKNISNNTIRLAEFDDYPGSCLDVLFFTSIIVHNEKGRFVAIKQGPGKIDIIEYPSRTTYIEVSKGKSCRRIINLNDYLRHGKSKLEPGLYRINVNYVNWYGGECIKGAFHSSELLLRVEK